MIAAVESLFPIITLIALGAWLKHRDIITGEQWSGIERIVYYVCFPCLIVVTLSTADFTGVPVGRMSAALFAAICTMSALLLLLRKPIQAMLDIDAPGFTSVFQGAARWNAFVAMALAGTLYGPLGISLTAIGIAAMIPALHSITVVVLLVYGENPASDPRPMRRIVYSLLTNPFIWACLIGVLIQASGFSIHAPVLTTLDILGRASLGLGVLAVGAGLRFPEALSVDRPVLFTNTARLIGMPLLMFGYTLLFGVSGPAQAVAVICGAVPCATVSYIMARQLGGDAPLMARIASSETLFAMATLPALVILITGVLTP